MSAWEQVWALRSRKWDFWVRQKDRGSTDKHILIGWTTLEKALGISGPCFLIFKKGVDVGGLRVLFTLGVPGTQNFPPGRSLATKMPLALVICPQTQCPWVRATTARWQPNFILGTANRAELEDTSPRVRPDFVCPQMMSLFCPDLFTGSCCGRHSASIYKIEGNKKS